jgi:L-cysteine:1D-myo-inositol 2-amino-2-deoxy-alpha-D-glucopyranoside ligase
MVDFTPTGSSINIYVCGITPYDSAHLGHIFTFLTYDLLQRRMEDLGHNVKLVRNITDVDEPIFKKAAANCEHYMELARREITAFQSDMRKLNFRSPDSEPLASDYIGEMAAAVQQLLNDGRAYRLDKDIYFDTSTFSKFGSFSAFSQQLQLLFMQERGGDPDRPGKRQPLDFLLWRGITDPRDPAAWDSPVGYGRPGWHIECSVMSSKLLNTPLDIHGGGMDLIFPHHECEISQSESLGRVPFSRHWLHVAPMLQYGEKMSKSLGNLVFAKDLLKHGNSAAIRFALMNYHYRTGGEWRDDLWDEARALADMVGEALRRPSGPDPAKLLADIRASLDNDLDTPQIVRTIRTFTRAMLSLEGSAVRHTNAAAGLRQALDLLGIAL